MPVHGTIERVCLNFGSRCNMSCDYCYIPFNNKHIEPAVTQDVVRRVSALGARVITIGGGDPFSSPGIEAIIETAHAVGLSVHVDSNGIGLRARHRPLLEKAVSLFALPLDGANSATHGAMRSSPRHFQTVLDRAKLISESGVPLKINTVVSALNWHELPDMANLVQSLGAQRWSLYQYWALSFGATSSARHSIPQETFSSAVSCLQDLARSVHVEVNPVLERHGTYLFVDQAGNAYTHEPAARDEYRPLGSIFDESTLIAWKTIQTASIREKARSRYPSLT